MRGSTKHHHYHHQKTTQIKTKPCMANRKITLLSKKEEPKAIKIQRIRYKSEMMGITKTLIHHLTVVRAFIPRG